MASRMRNLLNSRKGQFFILSAVTIITILFFVSRWIEPLRQTDTSAIVLNNEAFTFDNMKEKTTNVVKGSENCDDLNYNMQEYQRFVQRYALEKNYRLTFGYSIPSCGATATVSVSMKLHSDNFDGASDFSVNWP